MFNLNVVFLCLTVSVVFCEDYYQQQSNEFDYDTSLESCISQTNLSGAEFESMMSSPYDRQIILPKSSAQKCMMGCMMRKIKIINDGVVSVEMLTEYTLNFYGTNAFNKRLIFKRVVHLVDVCAKKDQLTTEECALAEMIITCIVEEAQKAGFTDESGHLVAELNQPFYGRLRKI